MPSWRCVAERNAECRAGWCASLRRCPADNEPVERMGRDRNLKDVAGRQPQLRAPGRPADVHSRRPWSKRPSAKQTTPPHAAQTDDCARWHSSEAERSGLRLCTPDRPVSEDFRVVRQRELVQTPWWIRIYDATWPAGCDEAREPRPWIVGGDRVHAGRHVAPHDPPVL